MRKQKAKSCSPKAFRAWTPMSTTKGLFAPRRRGGYTSDVLLLPRLKEFLHGFPWERKPSVDDAIDYLQKTYRDYSRKKKAPFRTSVQMIYDELKRNEMKLKAEKRKRDDEDDALSDKCSAADDTVSFSSDSELSEDEEGGSLCTENLVNCSMHEMYQTSNARISDGKTPSTMVEVETSFPMEKGYSIHDHLRMSENTPELVIKNDEEEEEKVEKYGSSKDRRRKTRRTSTLSNETKKSSVNNNLVESNEVEIPRVPLVKFSDLGGCKNTIQDVCKLLVHIKHPEVFDTLGITPPRGFLLHGPPGCGKSLFAHAIAGELDVPIFNVASTQLISGISGESEGKIRDVFRRAWDHSPCVLFIDEIDAITPKRENASKEMERRIVAQLLSCLDEMNRNKDVRVLVIGATNRPDSLDPALRRAGRFDREIRMGIPDERAREEILCVQCKGLKLQEEFDYKSLASQTPGFVGADLTALVREAAMCAVTRIFNESETGCSENHSMVLRNSTNLTDADKQKSVMDLFKSSEAIFTEKQLKDLCITMDDFKQALRDVQPSAKREGFATIPDVTWEDVGALEDVREELTMAIIAPVRHREAFNELGLTNPPGILLAGPPGCGKTLLAKAIANESGINFISVKGPELLNMYVGESERAVRQVFQRARNSAPCVIFFDELDALCPRRSLSNESTASARVVNQLLTEMDGLETRKQVFIMAATNRPDIIDPAILRPGRLDKTLYVGLPQEKDRLAILNTLTKGGSKPRLGNDVDLKAIASDGRCEGFSGADLAALIREACVNALRDCIKGSQSDENQNGVSAVVFEKHFEGAFEKIKASVSQKEKHVYENMLEKTGK